MALQINITTDSGITVEDSYARIGNIEGNKNNLNFVLNFYKNKASFQENLASLKNEYYSFAPNMDSNFIQQGYENLKMKEEYKNAIDLLDD